MLEAQVDVESEREILPQNSAEIGHGQTFERELWWYRIVTDM